MMRARAVCAVLGIALPAFSTAGPMPPPPSGYVPDAYVDGMGCAFARARVGSDVVWAEVLDVAGDPICTPTVGSGTVEIPAHRGGRPPFPGAGGYVQAGLFANIERAEIYARQIAAAGYGVVTQDFPRPGGRVQRVLFAGPLDDPAATAAALATVRALGFADAFVWPPLRTGDP